MANFEDMSEAQRNDLGKRLHGMLLNPDVAPQVKKLLQKTDPTLRFPELEVADAVQKELKERDEKISKLEAEQIRGGRRARRAERRAAASPEGLDPDEVEKAIVEKGITNWDTAVELVRLSKLAAPPTPANAYQHPPRPRVPTRSCGRIRASTRRHGAQDDRRDAGPAYRLIRNHNTALLGNQAPSRRGV